MDEQDGVCVIRSNLYLAKWLLLLPAAAARLLVPLSGRVFLQSAKISARNYRKMKALEAAKERERGIGMTTAAACASVAAVAGADF